MTLFGSSGAGKTYFLVSMFERYLKGVPSGASIRPIIWLSPEEKIDKTLAPLKKTGPITTTASTSARRPCRSPSWAPRPTSRST